MTNLNASITLQMVDRVSGSASAISRNIQTLAVRLEEQTAAANRVIAGSSEATRAAVASARSALGELTAVAPKVGQVASAALDDVIASGALSEEKIREVANESARLARTNAEQVAEIRELAKSEGLLANEAKRALRQMGRQASQALKEMVAANETAGASGQRVARTLTSAQTTVAAASARTARRSTAVTRAQRLQERNMIGVTRAAQNQGRTVGLLVNSVSELGFSLFAAIPGMQQLGTQMAIMGGTAFQLGGFLGVPGAAIGVLVGLIPTAVSALGLFGDAADEEGQRVESLASRFRSLTSAIESSRSEAERRAAALRGEGSDAEQEALIRQRREAVGQLGSEARDVLEDAAGTGRLTSGLGFRRVTRADQAQLLRVVRETIQANPFASDEDVLGRVAAADRASLAARGRAGDVPITSALTRAELASIRSVAARQIEAEQDLSRAEELRAAAVGFRSRRAQIEKGKEEENDRPGRRGPPDTVRGIFADQVAARESQATLFEAARTMEEAARRMEAASNIRVTVSTGPGSSATVESDGPAGVPEDQITPF